MTEPRPHGGGPRWLRTLRSPFSVLFWLLVATIAAPVILPRGPVVRMAMAVALFFVLLSGLRAVARHRVYLIAGAALGIPAVLLNGLGVALDERAPYLVSMVLYFLFFAYLAVLTLRHTLRQREVDAETIHAAVDVYLLMALVWGLAYSAIEVRDPGSFHFPAADPSAGAPVAAVEAAGAAGRDGVTADWKAAHDEVQGTLMYYSFVTLTTLGYGDVYPTRDAARILAMLEATLGQLYLVILVARLVGLYTAQERERRRESTPG